MHTHKHISTLWLILAVCIGLIVFALSFLMSEKTMGGISTISIVQDRFKTLTAEPFSTILQTRFNKMGQDSYCINDIFLSQQSDQATWNTIRAFLDTHMKNNAGDTESWLRTTVDKDILHPLVSLCVFQNELYGLRRDATTNTDTSHIKLEKITLVPMVVGEFHIPNTYTLAMRTSLFCDEAISITADNQTSAVNTWHHYKYSASKNLFEHVEWCDYWPGSEQSPYGTDPNLACKMMYQF